MISYSIFYFKDRSSNYSRYYFRNNYTGMHTLSEGVAHPLYEDVPFKNDWDAIYFCEKLDELDRALNELFYTGFLREQA